jgi:hypothetical protein
MLLLNMKIFATLALIVTSLVFLMSNSTASHPTPDKSSTTIVRIWRGWTTTDNALKLERALREQAIPGIEANKPKGLNGIELLTMNMGTEVQFTTIMYFDSIESVKAFAGEEYTKAHIDPSVAPLLLRYDQIVEHHILKEQRSW